jgi:quinol monooxygenase YgiN
MTMNPGLTLIAYLHGKPQKRDELLATLREFVKPTRAEAGCVEYHLHVSNDDPNLFILYENWESKLELDTHLKTELLTAFFNRRMDLLEKDVEMQFMTMDSPYDK